MLYVQETATTPCSARAEHLAYITSACWNAKPLPWKSSTAPPVLRTPPGGWKMCACSGQSPPARPRPYSTTSLGGKRCRIFSIIAAWPSTSALLAFFGSDMTCSRRGLEGVVVVVVVVVVVCVCVCVWGGGK